MMIRKYVVKEIPEAVVMIRRELGKDAVILNTRKVWVKKWLGLWRFRRIEVVAATGDDVPTRAPVARPLAQEVTPQKSVPSQPPKLVEMGTPRIEPKEAEVVNIIQERPKNDDEVQKLRDELTELKAHIESSSRLRTSDQWVQRFRDHLLSQQVKPAFAHVLMDRCAELQRTAADGSPLTFEGVRQSFMDAAMEAFSSLAQSRPLSPTSRIVGFIGPTGVGKTTTIAKLAALHVLTGDRKVGLITTDTFRIAAVDQLRTYANILGAPLQVVYQPSELPSAVEALSGCDLILVDTAGRNFTKEKPIDDIRALFSTVSFDEVHLVLSLTTKSEDMDPLMNGFHDFPVTQVLLTKIDETRTYGAFINLLLQFGRPLSYVTMGQNVPDDISVASTDRLLKLTAGGAIS